MKNIILILSLVFCFSCCAPVESNPDDNIDYTAKSQPRMVTITCYYLNGTTKVFECEYKDGDYDTDYVKIKQNGKIFIHVGQYDVIYDE